MLWKAFLFLGVVLVIAHCDELGDLQSKNDDPLDINRTTKFSKEQSGDVEDVTERDREPLGPDYKDPHKAEKPVLKPRPQRPSFNPSVIPGGVVDVDASTGPDDISGESGPGGIFSSFGSHFGHDGGFFNNFFGGFGDFQPWWKGPNVCIERTETTEDYHSGGANASSSSPIRDNLFHTSISLSNCQQSESKYECVTKINNHGMVKIYTVTYKCCHGYQRASSAPGCAKRVELRPLLQTVEALGAKEFLNVIKSTGLTDKYVNGNYTIFLPVDKAINEYRDRISDLNNVDLKMEAFRRRRNINKATADRELVLSHTVAGFVDLTDLDNHQVFHSENNNSTLRVAVYPTFTLDRMVTINCAKLVKPDNMAENGIVHLIDGVALPATQSIEEIIREHPRLTKIRQMFEATDSFKHLRSDGFYTFFAPVDEAFEDLNSLTWRQMMKGSSCAKTVLKHLTTFHPVCSCAITGNVTAHNINGDVLNMERKDDGVLLLEDSARILQADILATNGVVHVIDKMLIPESAQFSSDVMKHQNMDRFRELVEKAGLTRYVDDLQNVTIFAPNNKAFEQGKGEELLNKVDDIERLQQIVRYHIVEGELRSNEMNNNEMLTTNIPSEHLRLNLYSTLPLFSNVINRATLNCARVIDFDDKACGATIHEINRVLIPPEQTVWDLVQSYPDYSVLRDLIKDTEVEKVLSNPNSSVTLLAPPDFVFNELSEDDLKTLQTDKAKALEVINNHVLDEVLCCSGIGPQTWGYSSLVSTKANHRLQIGRLGSNQIKIGRATVTNCDELGTNGVVHTIDKVLLPQRRRVPNYGGFFLFDF